MSAFSLIPKAFSFVIQIIYGRNVRHFGIIFVEFKIFI
jgi:hypothetical protein